MEVFSPNILWHGGESENGKPAPAPVFGIDMLKNCLVTAGVNESTPPVGCVRLWSIPSVKASDGSRDNDTPKFLAELADHLGPVNTTRFSPCGRYLATASDRQIIVYKAKSKDVWEELNTMKDEWGNVIGAKSLERLRFQPSLTEIYDLRWSPDSSHVVAGALDNKAEIIRLSSRNATPLNGHTNYVQGVAWDPCNKMVVTQSSDRTCRVHAIKYSGPRAKIDTCGSREIKKIVSIGAGVDENVDKQMQIEGGDASIEDLNDITTTSVPSDSTTLVPSDNATPASNGSTTSAPNDSTTPASNDSTTSAPSDSTTPAPNDVITTPAPTKPTALKATAENRDKGRNLFADSTVPCFFRRPTFTPDGQLFIAPTGVYKHNEDITKPLDPEVEVSQKSFCTHVFSRNRMTAPIASLTGLEDPSVAVKCNPVLYKMKDYQDDSQVPMIPGKYRIVFAVTTTNGVYIYDTQHHYPIAKIGGIHYACVNDACWSEDGQMLGVCSSDGYVSFARFSGDILGEPVDPEDIPAVMREVPAIVDDPNGADGEVDAEGGGKDVDTGAVNVNVDSSDIDATMDSQVNISVTEGMQVQNTVTHVPLVKKKKIAPIFVTSSSHPGPMEPSAASSSSSVQGNGVDQDSEDNEIVIIDQSSSSSSSSSSMPRDDEPHIPVVRKKQRIAPETITTDVNSSNAN